MTTSRAPPLGLSTVEAGRLLAERGPNEIRCATRTPLWRILVRQFASPVIGLLVVAAGLAFALGERIDAVAILVIVAMNGVVGFLQEHRAESSVLALRAMTAPRARVLRDGAGVVMPAREIVVGDVLLLEAGDLVAADADLLEAHDLRVDEASLTGESVPVEKQVTQLPADTPLPKRLNRVFSGTAVTAGAGVAHVFATGMQTQLGNIAYLLETAEE